MKTGPERHALRTLKTATAIADPVLIRATSERCHMVLLAQDVIYDKAGTMRLERVRWVRGARGMKALFNPRREPADGFRIHVEVRRSAGKMLVLTPAEVLTRVPSTVHGFRFVNISAEQYLSYRAGSARQLLRAGHKIAGAPRRSRIAAAVRRLHRVRLGLRRALAITSIR